MPTHIDVLCGRYSEVITSNQQAIVADRKYLEREGPINFYSLYRCHNYHFKPYGVMFLGQFQPTIDAADEMVATLPKELLEVQTPPMADWLEGFAPMKMHVLIRFGKWQEIKGAKLPEDRDLFCVTSVMMHYAKSVACAASGDVAGAIAQQELFEAAIKRVPDTRYVFNNTCLDILAVAAEMLNGELAYRQEEHETAFTHLRNSVFLDDNLPYDELWAWTPPCPGPANIQKTFGAFMACMNVSPEAARQRKLPRSSRVLIARWPLADMPINASCYCRTSNSG